jgi:predicted DNA-binding protein
MPKLTLELSPDLRRRLAIEAAQTGKSNSAIVAELIDSHVKLPEDLPAFAASLEETPRAKKAKGSGRSEKKTSLYLPALTSIRLYLHAREAGEDQKSIIVGLIGQHIAPWAVYDPRISFTSTRSTGRRKSEGQASESGSQAA